MQPGSTWITTFTGGRYNTWYLVSARSTAATSGIRTLHIYIYLYMYILYIDMNDRMCKASGVRTRFRLWCLSVFELHCAGGNFDHDLVMHPRSHKVTLFHYQYVIRYFRNYVIHVIGIFTLHLQVKGSDFFGQTTSKACLSSLGFSDSSFILLTSERITATAWLLKSPDIRLFV